VNAKRSKFLQFCSDITGYSTAQLEGTGLVDTYLALIDSVQGPKAPGFHELVAKVGAVPADDREAFIRDVLAGTDLYPTVIRALISLWYLGVWTQLPNDWYTAAGLPKPGPSDPGFTHVPSSTAYIEQLSYRTASAHSPGARPTGFGSWSLPPVFDETV
jgi:hypothetical protein